MTKNLAFVFPGQGSQSLGMLSEFGDNALVRDTFSEASSALGYNLWTLCQEGPEDKLNQTEFAQPALLTAGVALFRAACNTTQAKTQLQNQIEFMAGHSLGEYSALVCAEAISLTAGVQLVAERGRLMQSAVPKGSGLMAAILGLEDEQIRALCEAHSKANALVSPANYNCPGQVVVAGHAEAVQRVVAEVKAMGKRALPLSVSVPSHCELMQPAALSFEKVLEKVTIQSPKIRILHNVDISEHSEPSEIRKALVQQLCRPVRWNETIQKMELLGIQSILECGPNSVLTGLNKRISPSLNCTKVTIGEVTEEA